MAIQIQCNHCQKTMKVKDSAAGRRGLCPFCKKEIKIPLVTKAPSVPILAVAEPYKVSKRLLGGFAVNYNCPQCSSPLTSNLDEAGSWDTCPQCSVQFVVPGKKELSKIESAKEQQIQEERERKEREQRLRKEADAERRKEEADARKIADELQQEEARTQAEIAKRPFDFPIPYTVKYNGVIEFRDQFFEVIGHQLRVNPDRPLSDGRLIIKSIQLFKKQVNMTKKENVNEIRETKAHFRANKPRVQKSRRKGLVSGLLNVGIEAARYSHAANLEQAMQPLEARKVVYDELLFACDQLIHQVEIRMAAGG